MSSLDVSSATQLHGDYNMDVEQDVMSPAILDHSYHTTFPSTQSDNGTYSTPSQSTDTIEGSNAVQESSESDTEDVKPNLAELNTVPFDSSAKGTAIQQVYDISSAVSGYIQNIPVTDVPYNVTHEDIARALSVNDEKVPVRIMRKVIPCLRITAYLKEAEFTGKKKIKGLWAAKPEDWPSNVPYKDPNNGEKIDGKLVPKANSEELRAMFKFLKNKVMLNIYAHINQLNQEELEVLKAQGNQTNGESKMGQYHFNTPQQQQPNGSCKVEVATSASKYQPCFNTPPQQQQAGQLSQPVPEQYRQRQYQQTQQQQQIKQETMAFVPYAPQSATSIPIFVANEDLGSSSPEQQANSSPDTSIDPSAGSKLVLQDEPLQDSDSMHESDNSEDGSESSSQYAMYVDEATGQTIYVQLPPDDSLSNSSSSDSVLEIVETEGQGSVPTSQMEITPVHRQPMQQSVALPVEHKREVKVPVKRQASVEPQVSVSQSTGGGKRIREERNISRGPIQQVSSQQRMESELQKARVEVAPQKRATPLPQQVEPVPSPQASCPAEVMVNPPVLHQSAPMSCSHQPITIYPSGPMNLYNPQDMNRLRLLEDLHSRLRDKVMQLQSLILGDVEISIALNKLYKDVVLLQYQKAQIGHQNQFINAAHGCEALLDRAMLDGKNYQKEQFVEECNALIKKHSIGCEEQTQKTTVLTVTAPEHPPVQANLYAKLQDKVNMDESPFSPSGLSDKMGNLLIEKTAKPSEVDLSNPTLLGIKPRTNDGSMMALLNGVVEPFKQTPQQPDDDLLLPIPEKLNAMGVNLEAHELSQEALDDLFEQLKQFANSIDPAKPQYVVEISDDDDDDDKAIDVKKQKVNADVPNQTSQKIVGKPQKRGPKADSSMMKPTNPMMHHNNNIMWSSLVDKDEVIDEVLGLEDDYEHYMVDWTAVQGQKTPSVENEPDKTPLQPATPDDGNICIATAFGNASTSSKQKSMANHINHGKKPYQRIQPKPQSTSLPPPPSYSLSTYGASVGGVNNFGLPSPVNTVGQFNTFSPTTPQVFTTPQMTSQTMTQQLPATNVFIQQNAFGGGLVNNIAFSGPASNMSCIPEVVENFESPQKAVVVDDCNKRPRGRKRIHNE